MYPTRTWSIGRRCHSGEIPNSNKQKRLCGAACGAPCSRPPPHHLTQKVVTFQASKPINHFKKWLIDSLRTGSHQSDRKHKEDPHVRSTGNDWHLSHLHRAIQLWRNAWGDFNRRIPCRARRTPETRGCQSTADSSQITVISSALACGRQKHAAPKGSARCRRCSHALLVGLDRL